MSQSEVAAPIPACDSAKSNKGLKVHRPEKWETHAIGEFLLKLYKQQILSNRCNWIVSKDRVRQEFAKYLRQPGNENYEKVFIELNGTADIGTLLFRTRFLINTQRGSPDYRIRDINLFQYRDYKLEELDKLRRNAIGDGTSDCSNDKEHDAVGVEVEEVQFLIYQGSELQMRKTEFSEKKPGCFVCQLNFGSALELEEHIVLHSEESNFELQSSSTFKKFDTSIFKISYVPCKNSHIMRFTLETTLPKVVIEKVVLVQSRSFHYLNDARVPYNIEGNDTFYLNSQFFTEFLEQPIIIIFHTNTEDMRLMEQHHFVHSEVVPVVQLNLNAHRLSNESKFEPLSELPDHNPDDDLLKAMENDFPTEYLIKIRPQFYEYIAENKKLNLQNMQTVLKVLLQIEDFAFRRANLLLLQREVKLRLCEKVYSLKMKYLWWSPEITGGRLQNLPNVGDEIFLVQESGESITMRNVSIFQNFLNQGYEKFREEFRLKQKTFVGRIKRVIDGRILFESEENILLDKLYIVIIFPLRWNVRQQQNALASIDSLTVPFIAQFLFPQNVDNPMLLPSNNLVLQNEGIRDDNDQLQAVRNIASDAKFKAPYIITGGPGSGKTAVIVESIFQLYLRCANSKILVVASMDSACDEIALRLCKVLCKMHDEHAIARIYEYDCKQRREKIDELLLEYSNLYAKHHFLPSVDVLHEFRILVCTAELVGRLTLGRFGKTSNDQGVFTHIFLDDAATLTEPESLVCLVNTLAPNTKLILTGDPKQMDPTLYSARAKELGLSVSFIERLLALDCYFTDDDGNYNRSILTKLMRNYRSHPKMVYLYNCLYYENKMVSFAPPKIISLPERWYRIPNPNYPIIFHEVSYCMDNNTEINMSSCVSTYNAQEIDVVLNYTMDLMYNGINGRKVAQKDIGIISPYKKQALRIQDQLNLRGWYQIDVGTPEDFLGKEKSIIMVSFVWAMPNSLDILNNSRRLNFMISRAKSLLILVGNTKILNQFRDFKTIIDECRKNGSLLFGNSAFWQELKPQNFSLSDAANNDNSNDDANGDDGDDTRSQCSEMSTSGAKKRRNRHRNRGNKAANKAATTTQSGTPNKGDDNTKKQNQNENQTNDNKNNAKEKGKGKESEKPKNSNNNNKNANGYQNTTIDPIDELLNSLPSVPSADAETLNAIKNMKEDIVGRMQKLKVETSSSITKLDEPLATTSSNQNNDHKTENVTLQHQKIKVQKQLNRGNAAVGHGHVKRLDHNNQKRQANNHSKGNSDNKKNSPNAQQKGNQTNNESPNQQYQQDQNTKVQQQPQSKLQPEHGRKEQFNFVPTMQWQQPPPLMQFPFQYPQQPPIRVPYFQQAPQTYPQQQYFQMPIRPHQEQQQPRMQQTQQQQQKQQQHPKQAKPPQPNQQQPQPKQQQSQPNRQQPQPKQQQLQPNQQQPQPNRQQPQPNRQQPQPNQQQLQPNQQQPQPNQQQLQPNQQQPQPNQQQSQTNQQQSPNRQQPQPKQQQLQPNQQQSQPIRQQPQPNQQQPQPNRQHPQQQQSPIRQLQNFENQERQRRQRNGEDKCVIA